MRIVFGIFIVLAAFFLVSEIGAQNTTRDAKAIAKIKNLQVFRLDRRLPAKSFSQWFGKVIGKSQKIEWEVNDCGEQDGSGRQKDFPICVQARAYTVDLIEVSVLVTVGTHRRGIVGKPSVWGIWVETRQNVSKDLDALSDLPQELVRLKQMKT